MTASALNIASINPAAAAGAGASSAAASGPLAGFEALLAALFPQVDPAAATPAAPTGQAGQATAPVTVDTLLDAPATIEGETATESTETASDAPVAEAPATAGDAAAALAAALIATQPATVETAATTVADAGTDAVATPTTAFGRHKTKGAPALPAILHANAKAGLVEKAELAEEAADPSAPLDGPALPEQAKGPPQGVSARNTPAAPTPNAPAAAPALAAAPVVPAPDAQPDLPPPPVAAAAEAPANIPPADAPTVAPVAAGLVARPDAAPPSAPALRTNRSERAKSATETTGVSEDLTPREATDKPVHAKAAEGAARASGARIEPEDAKVADAEGSLDAPDAAGQSEARAASQSAAPAAETATAARGSPETVANLAAQILKKLDGKSTRFDVELDPLGLGKVDVRIEIGAHGRVTAAMTFENPQAAQDVKARANELQRMLEQAGFDLTGGMTFDVAGDRGQRQGQAWQDQAETGHTFRGQAFRAALDTAGDAAAAANLGALRLRRGVNLGVDLKI